MGMATGNVTVQMVSMGFCADCSQPWEMPITEKVWWDKKVRKDGAIYPKRCKPCRDKNRMMGGSRSNSIMSIIDKLERMSYDAINDFYEERPDILAQELADLAEFLKPFRGLKLP